MKFIFAHCILTSIILGFGFPVLGLAQNYSPWFSINPNGSDGLLLTGGLNRMEYSENLDMLIFLDALQRPNGSRYLAGFDGENWQILDDTVNNGCRTVVDYAGGILVGGTTANIGEGTMPNMAYYDGNQWSYPWSFNHSIIRLRWANDTLFALGFFTEVDGNPAHYIAKLAGDTWQGVITAGELPNNAIIRDIAYFQGQYYIAGNINNSSGQPSDLAILENGQLHFVGSGVVGGSTDLISLEVYQGELYMAGVLSQSSGNVGNGIQKWDGINFSSVGGVLQSIEGSLNTGAGHMVSHNGFLYVSGSFGFIDGFPIQILARWDGSQWCGLHTQGFTATMLDFGIIDNKVVGVILQQFNPETGLNNELWLNPNLSDTDICTELLNVFEKHNGSFQIFPNPARARATIQSAERIIYFRLYNSLGIAIKAGQPHTERFELDLNGLTPGLYLVETQSDKGVGVQKLVVE